MVTGLIRFIKNRTRVIIMKRKIAAFIVSGIWISLSEFVRNVVLFRFYWIDKYNSLGIVFPENTVNNGLWGLWSFTLSGLIVYLTPRLSTFETAVAVWISSFAMMWIVIGNLNVLPYKLLVYAFPLSILEIAIAVFICRKLTDQNFNKAVI